MSSDDFRPYRKVKGRDGKVPDGLPIDENRPPLDRRSALLPPRVVQIRRKGRDGGWELTGETWAWMEPKDDAS